MSAAITQSSFMKIPAEVGALRLWWTELQSGERLRSDRDAIWRAACYEARARDEVRDGLLTAAREDRIRAAEIIADALSEVLK
jgi:hypothetical protein